LFSLLSQEFPLMCRHTYPTDLTDEQWALLAPLLPPASTNCRPRKVDLREVVNAILYLLRTGCAWRLLPHDLPSYRTVFYYFSKWRKCGVWKKIHDKLHQRLREEQDRQPTPSAAILDSQSAKTGEKGGRSAATTLARKLKDASAILSSIPWD
jgi:putative transposase